MQSIVGWSEDQGDGIFCPGKTCKEDTVEVGGQIDWYFDRVKSKTEQNFDYYVTFILPQKSRERPTKQQFNSSILTNKTLTTSV